MCPLQNASHSANEHPHIPRKPNLHTTLLFCPCFSAIHTYPHRTSLEWRIDVWLMRLALHADSRNAYTRTRTQTPAR